MRARAVAQPPHARALRRWLNIPGPLSSHLKALGTNYRVDVMSQRSQSLLPIEAQRLQVRHACAPRHAVREVLLSVDGAALVWARSITQARYVQGPWHSIARLGNKPLAQILFHDHRIQRHALAPQRLARSSPMHGHIRRMLPELAVVQKRPGTLWLRCAVFKQKNAWLLVQEVFLPAIGTYPVPHKLRSSQLGCFQ
jgi:chorismate lyase